MIADGIRSTSVSSGLVLLTLYLIGVVIGLVRLDGPIATKIGVALVWPLGLAAFVVTITMLVGVAAIAFPLFGTVLVAALVAAWFTF